MKQRIIVFMVGLVAGALLCGGSVAYAAGVAAKYAPQTAYVDGAPVQMEAYNIGGYNYVKLRAIGQMVGFNVYWDGKSVQIDSDAPYTGEAPTQQADTSIRVSSVNGNTLKVGSGSSLLTSPYGIECTAVSSDTKVLSLEKVLGYWVVTANTTGTATVTLTAQDGRSGSITITVEPADPATSTVEYPVDLNANMEIRQEMIRLINQVRRENGVKELSINEALMNAAQTCSARRYTWHHSLEECKIIADAGYPNGCGSNLTAFTGTADAAQRAVTNWINSPGHFQTMIDPDADCIGVGVTQCDGITYCYMLAGKPNSVNFYA